MKGEYGETEEDKLNNKITSQHVLYLVLNDFSRIMAPFMPFISERIYQGVNLGNQNKRESVHLESWPVEFLKVDAQIIKEMDEVRDLVQKILFTRQTLKLPVRQPMGVLILGSDYESLSEDHLRILIDEVNFKIVEIDKHIIDGKYIEGDKWFFQSFDPANLTATVIIDKEITPLLKKEGDYRELVRKVKDLRKEIGLTVNDIVALEFKADQKRIDFVKSLEEDLKKDCKLSEVKFEEGESEEIKILK